MSAIAKPSEYGVIPREIALRMSGLELLQAVISGAQPGPPIAQTADFWITEVENGRVVFEAMPSMKFYNPLGTVHGGWISALLDSAWDARCTARLPPARPIRLSI
jgi:acyl-coenzyme A thioesterase PaaI-like protein